MPNFLTGFPGTNLVHRLACGIFFCVLSTSALATNVVFHTSLGDIEVELFDEEAPLTVANFLKYVNDGDYTGTFMHRSVRNFIIQGGAFTFPDGAVAVIPTDPPVANEPGISNLRGTIAMAKTSQHAQHCFVHIRTMT